MAARAAIIIDTTNLGIAKLQAQIRRKVTYFRMIYGNARG